MTTQSKKTKAAPAKTTAAAKPKAPQTTAPDTSPAEKPAATGPTGKLGKVVEMMRRPEGATVQQMSEATGWQAHSVRGALAGSLKKKHGLTIVSEKGEAGRVYRIAGDQAA